MVYIILGEGFEEIEALAPCDILRRGGVRVSLAGIGSKTVVGGHGIKVEADCLVEEIDTKTAEMIVFPGGSVGVESIRKSSIALGKMLEMHKMGKETAAICAAPTILAKLGMLDGKKVVCYPGLEGQLDGAEYVDEPTMRDGKLTTGRAAGASIDFGLKLLEVLRGTEKSEEIRKAIYY